MRRLLVSLACVHAAAVLAAQQMPDRSFRPMIEDRAYAIGTGPVVCVDDSHANAYTLANGFSPFGDLVRRDGYVVRSLTTVEPPARDDCRILVIAAPRSRVEAAPLRRWVADGGSLLLAADPGSQVMLSDLLASFGVSVTDASVRAATFRAADQTLRAHAIVRGRHAKESPASVMAFAVLAMRVPPLAEPLLVAADGSTCGAVMRVERGRVGFFGDPALFTARIAGPDRRLEGMSARGAEQNFHFVLNVMHWLSGMI